MPKIGVQTLTPYWQTNDGSTVRLYQGHSPTVLRRLPVGYFHTVVTSPPYWGLRSYLEEGHEYKGYELGSEPSPDCLTQGKAQCGACFVCNMVGVFREVRRVLRDDGTVWLNLGDNYASGGGAGFHTGLATASEKADGRPRNDTNWRNMNGEVEKKGGGSSGLPSGNLVGVPWRVALALQADGWILRQDIVWAKPSPMPESVRNRCTKAHEYIFLLVKKQGYYYDAEAIKEKGQPESEARYNSTFYTGAKERAGRGLPEGVASNSPGTREFDWARNKRSVWNVSSQGYPGAHFATFPPKLIEPCIKAGTSAKGCCGKCGAPYKRLMEETKLTRERPNDYVKRTGEEGTGNSCPNTVAGVETRTVGWEAGCDCGAYTVPCRVLDPFFGAGTTGVVCLDLGLSCVGIDLSEKYLKDNAVPRIEGVCLARPALSSLVRKERQRVVIGKKV